jgi:hypothetical protein
MLKNIRTLLIGYHNPILHGYFVCQAWKKIYKKYPTSREFVCIILHDIGYLSNSKEDKHPLLGAMICNYLFGIKYYNLCIGHSRDYSKRYGISVSPLCYADKYAILLIPVRIHQIIFLLDSPSITKEIIMEYRSSCKKYLEEQKLCQ